jgi:hypothetical protein
MYYSLEPYSPLLCAYFGTPGWVHLGARDREVVFRNIDCMFETCDGVSNDGVFALGLLLLE